MPPNILAFPPSAADKLLSIPGLHLHGIHATGSIDALAAGAMVLGKPVKPPIPGGVGKLLNGMKIQGARDYQNHGIAWMVTCLQQHGGAILADEMGLGKTFQSINVMRSTMAGRALVLCPGSVRETWRDELLKWDPEAKVAILYPGGAEWDDISDAKYVVCSHDYRMIDRAMTLGFAADLPEFLIIDEAHRFRGRKSKRSDVMEMVGALIPYKIALTGTPQWNTMKDWWQLLRIILPGRFGSQWDFDRRYAGAKPGQFGGLEYPRKDDSAITPKLLNAEEMKLRLSFYMLSRTKQEVAKDLPPMSIHVRWVDGTDEAKRALRKFQMGVKSSGSLVTEAILATLKGKIDETLALAAEAKRFVLTTWTNEGASQLHRLLNEAGTPCTLLSASMSGPKRSLAIQDATTRRIGIVATTDLLAEGLNLQKVASVGILHALDFVPKKMQQLMGRLHRIDIVNPVDWYVVAMKDSIDKYIIEAGVFKMDNSQRTMGRKEQLRGAFVDEAGPADAKAALAKLYSLMED